METNKNTQAISTTKLAFAGASKSNMEYLIDEKKKNGKEPRGCMEKNWTPRRGPEMNSLTSVSRRT